MSTDAQTIYQRLSEQFPTEAHKKVKKGGREQTYIPWTDKVSRFNEVLRHDWSFRIVREGLTETEAWALGEVSVTIGGVTTTRQQYGCEPIMRGQSKATDLFKIAGTDALSKAATLFGCGLYLSDQEERAEVEAAMQEAIRASAAEQRKANQPAPPTPRVDAAAQLTGADPTVLKTKLELIADLQRGLEYARSLGLDPDDVDGTKLNRVQLEETIDSLRAQCRAVRAEQRKAQAS
jgi:hypothetical protein